MASPPSKTTNTSTITKPDPKSLPESTTAIGKKTSNEEPTASIQTPVLTDVVQKCVDTVAEVIATSQIARLFFIMPLCNYSGEKILNG